MVVDGGVVPLRRRGPALLLLGATVALLTAPQLIANGLKSRPAVTKSARAQALGAAFITDSGIVLQQSDSDCGAAALSMALASFGVRRERSDLVVELHTDRTGASLLEMRRASQRSGIPAQSWRLRKADIAEVPLPAIAWIGRNHFVVIRRRIDALTLEVDDPSLGRLAWPVASFFQVWSGETLVFHSKWVPPAG
jgi:predicted double-glycine peptidase